MPAPRRTSVTATELMDTLREVYWNSVSTEARNMIEFYVQLRNSDLTLKPRIPFDACSESFKRIFDVWVGSQSDPGKVSSEDLYKETIETTRRHFESPGENRDWAARLILQASGLLDVDILYEPTDGSQRCLRIQKNWPNVEQVELSSTGGQATSIRGITCSQCQRLIRSPAFYECKEKCETRCFYEVLGDYSLAVCHECLNTASDHSTHPPFRICSVCVSGTPNFLRLTPCEVGHLQEVRYSSPNIKNLPLVCVQLNRAESNHRKENEESNPDFRGNDHDTARTRFIQKCLQASGGLWPVDPRHFIRTVGLMMKGHYAPSGNFHLSFMFGALILESGLPRINRGVLISSRPPPAFFSDGGAGFLDDAWRTKAWPFFYWDRKDGKPCLGRTEETYHRQRPILACLKRVYGAAFTGYPESARQREDDVVNLLVKCGDEWSTIDRSLKDAVLRRERLGELADELQSQLKICLGEEVDKYLSHVANTLIQNKNRGEWSMLTNNCQLLVNSLLNGNDFEYIIPLPPKDFQEQSFQWPRYLFSFGNHTEGFGKSLYQPNCLMTQYSQSKPTVDYDLIQFMERCKEGHPKSLSATNKFISSGNAGQGDTEAGDTHLALLACLEQLWTLPGDTLSLLQFHFLRSPYKNPDHLDDSRWVESRLRVMQLLDVVGAFTSALGNSLYRLFTRDPKLLSRITIPPARVLGNVRADEKLRIIDTLGARGTFYDITNRVPNAMSQVVEKPSRFWKISPNSEEGNDPIHGEEVVCRIVGWFVAPLSAMSPAVGAAIGGSFRLHENCWIAVNIGTHTYVRQYLFKKAKRVRNVRGK